MSNKWRKEFRYSITKNGKFYNQYQDQDKAIKICRELEKNGFEVIEIYEKNMPLKEKWVEKVFGSHILR